MDEALKAKVEGYLRKAAPLFADLRVEVQGDVDLHKAAEEFYEMATAYYKDAQHFRDKGDYVDALAALEYAEGWMDAGKRLGVFRRA